MGLPGGKLVSSALGAASGTAGVGTALGLLGGGLDFLGNKSLQNDAQSFSREMARNKYQWAADDLSKAGLNRILAFGAPGGMGAGAGTPGAGSTRTNIPAAISSAVQLRRVNAEIDLLREQGRKTHNEANFNQGTGDVMQKLLSTFGGFFNTALDATKSGWSSAGKFLDRMPEAMRSQRTLSREYLKDPRKKDKRKYWDDPRYRNNLTRKPRIRIR